jgi:hypothetical protein
MKRRRRGADERSADERSADERSADERSADGDGALGRQRPSLGVLVLASAAAFADRYRDHPGRRVDQVFDHVEDALPDLAGDLREGLLAGLVATAGRGIAVSTHALHYADPHG